MASDYRDTVIETLADSEAALRDDVSHLRCLLSGYHQLVFRLLHRLDAVEGDDIRGMWEALDDAVNRGDHPPPRSIVAKLKRNNRQLHAALRAVHERQRAVA